MDFPKELKYTDQHEWLRIEGDEAVVGITDYAQHSLGDVVYVELPEKDTEIVKGESFGVVESVKAASDIYAPISGKVSSINEELEEHPEFINQSPYEKGWIIKVRYADSKELDNLMDNEAYQKFVKEQEENQ